MELKNKIIVITGASSGIGEASAIRFAEKKAKLVLVGRRKEKLLDVEKKFQNSRFQHSFVNVMFLKNLKLRKCVKKY